MGMSKKTSEIVDDEHNNNNNENTSNPTNHEASLDIADKSTKIAIKKDCYDSAIDNSCDCLKHHRETGCCG